MRLRLLAAALIALRASSAQAAPCCGAGSAVPTLITGDDLAQLSATLSQADVVGDAPVSGLPVFRAPGDDELAQTLRIEGALLLGDRWQAGASLPIVRRTRATPAFESSSTGLGDASLSGAYEALPEWEYSAWKPRGYVFAQALLPTGSSIYDMPSDPGVPWALDSRGRGFFALGAGALFVKGWANWDASLLAEAHRALPRSFTDARGGGLRVTPGWGGSAAVAAGYSPNALPVRFGAALAPAYESGLSIQALTPSVSKPQLVWNASAQLSWMPTRETSVSALYTDQTLLGPATNVTLSRTLAITLQKRWER